MNDNNRIYAGIIGGLCESVIMQPIDTIKVLRQSNQYNGLFNHINKNGVRKNIDDQDRETARLNYLKFLDLILENQ